LGRVGSFLFAKARYAHLLGSRVFPKTAEQLDYWRARAADIPNDELRQQALASIRHKHFHAEGGSVYAATVPERLDDLVRLIVALQTISDYLDNLCDRSVSMDGNDFRQLHYAMLDAVDTGSGYHDYYALHPNTDDGGYLEALVTTCKEELRKLPSYEVVRADIARLVSLYDDLQVYKHIHPEKREPRLTAWFEEHRQETPGLKWYEFAAATGSTLGVFALFVEAARPGLEPEYVRKLVDVYFPWVCGFHILLDYFIDQAEDRRAGDLNFVSYYPDREVMTKRLIYFARESGRRVLGLSDAAFHELVVEGLPALYLSDRKVPGQHLKGVAWRLILAGGLNSVAIHGLCVLRRFAHGEYCRTKPVTGGSYCE